MKEKKQSGLSREQKKFLAAFAGGECTLSELRRRRKIRPEVFEPWLEDRQFVEAMNACLLESRRDSRVLLAQSASKAIRRLIEIMQDDGEAGRKVCLDILKLSVQDDASDEPLLEDVPLEEELAEKILEMLSLGAVEEEEEGGRRRGL